VNDADNCVQEKAKSTRLQESVKQLNAEKARTESLLYQMIPKSVADRLREGESHANTCQASHVTEYRFGYRYGPTADTMVRNVYAYASIFVRRCPFFFENL